MAADKGVSRALDGPDWFSGTKVCLPWRDGWLHSGRWGHPSQGNKASDIHMKAGFQSSLWRQASPCPHLPIFHQQAVSALRPFFPRYNLFQNETPLPTTKRTLKPNWMVHIYKNSERGALCRKIIRSNWDIWLKAADWRFPKGKHSLIVATSFQPGPSLVVLSELTGLFWLCKALVSIFWSRDSRLGT